MFGIVANISETFGISQISDTFKHLIRASKGLEKIEITDENGKPSASEKDRKLV